MFRVVEPSSVYLLGTNRTKYFNSTHFRHGFTRTRIGGNVYEYKVHSSSLHRRRDRSRSWGNSGQFCKYLHLVDCYWNVVLHVTPRRELAQPYLNHHPMEKNISTQQRCMLTIVLLQSFVCPNKHNLCIACKACKLTSAWTDRQHTEASGPDGSPRNSVSPELCVWD